MAQQSTAQVAHCLACFYVNYTLLSAHHPIPKEFKPQTRKKLAHMNYFYTLQELLKFSQGQRRNFLHSHTWIFLATKDTFIASSTSDQYFIIVVNLHLAQYIRHTHSIPASWEYRDLPKKIKIKKKKN